MKRILGAICLLLTLLLCLAGCEYFAPKHEHSFSQSYDETVHFQKCPCGEITDKAEHSLEWVIDKEPTATENGCKHLECGCGFKANEDTLVEFSETNLSDKQKLVEQFKQDFGDNSGTILFTADTFAQDMTLSWMYSIDVRITDNNIYLNDDLYDDVTIIDGSQISCDEKLIKGASAETSDDECSRIIQSIISCESIYVLESEKDDGNTKKIAIYIIDDSYYFLSFHPDADIGVIRIHYFRT
jgi:hypothetical protein